MKHVYTEGRVPVCCWAEYPERDAIGQALNVANHPYAFHHVVALPDVHWGAGMPIGCVAAMKGVVIPNAVGVDIGCGMAAARTSLQELDLDKLKAVLSEIRKAIPLGVRRKHKQRRDEHMPLLEGTLPVARGKFKDSSKKLGTLGAGNHFIEIQAGGVAEDKEHSDSEEARQEQEAEHERMMWIGGAIGAAIYLGGGGKREKPEDNKDPYT